MGTITERRPQGSFWVRAPPPPGLGPVIAASGWRYGRIVVISALEDAELPDKSGRGPQWHISVSRNGARPTPPDVRKALRSFRLVGAEEDNHHPGNARHFWCPVDPAHRVTCECKADEQLVVEPDGYAWTNPRPETGEACRGCDISELTSRPCPLHASGGSEAA